MCNKILRVISQKIDIDLNFFVKKPLAILVICSDYERLFVTIYNLALVDSSSHTL